MLFAILLDVILYGKEQVRPWNLGFSSDVFGRWREIHASSRDYKTKNKKNARFEKILMSYRTQHKNGKRSDNVYIDQFVVAIHKAWAPYESQI